MSSKGGRKPNHRFTSLFRARFPTHLLSVLSIPLRSAVKPSSVNWKNACRQMGNTHFWLIWDPGHLGNWFDHLSNVYISQCSLWTNGKLIFPFVQVMRRVRTNGKHVYKGVISFIFNRLISSLHYDKRSCWCPAHVTEPAFLSFTFFDSSGTPCTE